MMKAFFRRKSVSALLASAQESEHSLSRTLTGKQLMMLGVGGIIGAGIFVLTGQAAAQYAGPAIIISFILSGIACAFAALCYAELSAMIPVSGSAYTFAYATLGEFIAWIIGWDLVLEYLVGGATVAVGWSGYVSSFLKDIGYNIPTALSSAPLAHSAENGWQSTGAIINLPAVLVVLFMTVLLVRGIKESARFNNLIVAIKLTVLVLFVVAGLSYVSAANLNPFIPENTGVFGSFGWSGIFRGAAVIFFAYIGFDCVSTLAQEAKDPQRDMPVGIIGSLIIATVFYVIVAFVLTGMVHYTKLGVADPIAVALDSVGDSLHWLRMVVKLGAIAGLTSVILVLLMGQPRIFFAMSKDGLLPPVFSKVHPHFKTPYIPTIVTGLLAALMAGLFPIGLLGELVSIGTLLAFLIVCLGVLVLRRVDPHTPRPFKTPYVVFVSLAGAFCALGQMAVLPLGTWVRLIVWMAVGFLIYFVYGAKHSKLISGVSK